MWSNHMRMGSGQAGAKHELICVRRIEVLRSACIQFDSPLQAFFAAISGKSKTHQLEWPFPETLSMVLNRAIVLSGGCAKCAHVLNEKN